ncbi:PREDICTED: SUPPRESSOR OF ABI3-5 isoform X2 [Tarenaya hassleriana]|uniref:SUPPRESSOR OF ABI3-5 isoform X2 n=1 Tax=Tarenaya hassleriana TaxID=28532 RepID=UPI00053C133B|nr:PREDICTED: SUPPRESSOR OF ABI3-5 isoform X2 [Tarenaya hassleriana]
MDRGRYGLQQGWDNNSAPEGYGAVHDPSYRCGGSYDDIHPDERFSRDNVYDYQPGNHALGALPQSRRRNYEEDYSRDGESRKHEKPYIESYHTDNYHDDEMGSRDGNHRDHGYEKSSRYSTRGRDDYHYEYRSRNYHHNREDSHERDYDYARRSYDSDYERGSERDANRRSRDSRDREWEKRHFSHERDESPHNRNGTSRSRSRSRSWSRGGDEYSRSRSPRGWSHGRGYREDSYDDDHWHERRDSRRERGDRHYRDHFSAAPSATVVVKGLSMKTTEEDLYQILAEWGPLDHVRVIRERNSGISRGVAFIDFASVEAARAMMDKIGHDGLVVDGKKLFFHYSKPTGSMNVPRGQENSPNISRGGSRRVMIPADWICTICGCINFARRTSCFQCNEPKTEDAPPADVGFSNSTLGKRGSEAGPTHVLVVRGLDENADEEMIRYEFSKHAPIKDLRLVRDKFTHVSRGFAFVHFHSVEDATKALQATNGTTLERNGKVLRVAYAKSVLGSAAGTSAPLHSSSLAAAAIEAAAFSQQYDAVGWAPKEYNPDARQTAGQNQGVGEVEAQQGTSAPHSGYVWDEASGYYYDAASGFYYDGNSGLYYDSNSAVWYSYDHQTQQYIPCPDQTNESKPSDRQTESAKMERSNNKKVIISAPAATSIPDAVQAAAEAAMAAEKKEKEKAKEIKLASKSIILANKKKMSNILTTWKQRSHETQTQRIALDDSVPNVPPEERRLSVGQFKGKPKSDAMTKENTATNSAFTLSTTQTSSNSTAGPLTGVLRGSLRGVVKLDSTTGVASSVGSSSLARAEASSVMTPFKTDVSALGSYTAPSASGSGRRRFSEMPTPASTQRDQPQSLYRDRAAERRNLYGSTSIGDDDLLDAASDSHRDFGLRKGSLDPTPFPPGVGGGHRTSADVQSYDVITAERAIDESNVGNRMLRNMGWHEGSGLGKDGSGMTEPVQAQAVDRRAGLGSQQKKVVDPTLEVQAGDSYKTLIHKKAVARFREMTENENER